MKVRPAAPPAAPLAAASKASEEADPPASDDNLPAKKNKKKSFEFKKSKEENLVRQDLKKKWKDRFKGGVNALKLRFTKNGKLKQTYRKTADAHAAEDKPTAFDDIQANDQRTNNTKKQFYERSQKQNMYMNCLSDALMVTLEGDGSSTQPPPLEETIQPIDREDLSEENMKRVLKRVYGFDSFRSG